MAQIDLLIDRRDLCINLCEMKFYNSGFAIDKKYADELRRKETAFKEQTKTRKQIFHTLITTFELVTNEHSIGLIDSVVTMDELFVNSGANEIYTKKYGINVLFSATDIEEK